MPPDPRRRLRFPSSSAYSSSCWSGSTRVNEYGRKSLELLIGDVVPALHYSLTFVQHLFISGLAALPLILLFERFFGASGARRTRILVGAAYGAGFYVVMNSIALPLAFGDPTPWALGFETVYPSLAIHVIYGAVLGWAVQARDRVERS